MQNIRQRLTPRELEVLKLLAKGNTRRDIGNHLNISVNTVKSTLRTAYMKLGAGNKAEAVYISMSLGLLK